MGETDPSLAGLPDKETADRPDMSLVRLETRADVSEADCDEHCLARLGMSPTLPGLAPLADTLR
jgi:hypothetical protein